MKNASFLQLDAFSKLATVNAADTPAAIEAALAAHRLTLGLDGLDGDPAPLSDYLKGECALGPYLKYGGVHDLVAAVQVELPDGQKAETFLSPRSAAGPDLRYLLCGDHDRHARIVGATLRVHDQPEAGRRAVYLLDFLDEAVDLLRDETHARNRPQLVRLFGPESVRALFGERERRSLLVVGYEGGEEEVEFRFGRMVTKLDALRGTRLMADLPPHYFNAEQFPPLWVDLKENESSEVILHAATTWSKLMPLFESLERRSGGIYTLQTTLTGLMHESALLSLRLLSYEGERDRTLIARETEDVLHQLVEHRAVIRELRPLNGRIDKRWESLFSDSLTARLG